MEHHTNPYIEFRKRYLRPLEKRESHFNGWLAVKITSIVGTMWCAYAFGLLALISFPQAIHSGTSALIAWIAQTFLQLVLLSIIIVGQNVLAAASDKRAEATFEDADAVLHTALQIQDHLAAHVHHWTLVPNRV